MPPKCYEPPKNTTNHTNYLSLISSSEYQTELKDDTVWFLMKTGQSSWAAYNSILGRKTSKTAVIMLPVINGSPTGWEKLYEALKKSKKLRHFVYRDGKTSISFDLQLYIKATRLRKMT